MYLNDKEIINILDEYVSNPKKNYAVLIDGEWGCGKTYFIKNEYIKNDKNKLYISLYGIKSKEEITKKIYYTIVEKDIKISDGLKIAGKSAEKVAETVIEKKFKIDIKKFDFIDISGLIALFKDIKDYILVFDDLERCDMPINEVLGYINEYVEHKEVKVIIIANENEINKINYDTNYELKVISALNNNINFEEDKDHGIFKISGENNKDKNSEESITINNLKNRVETLYEGNKKYKLIKEKLIGFTIKYKPDLSKVYDHMIENYKNEKGELYDFLSENKEKYLEIMKVNKCNNVRTVVFVFYTFEELYEKVKKVEKSNNILRLVFKNVIYCAIGVKRGLNIERILDGAICNPSATLNYDSSYRMNYYFTAFDFVNDYIINGKIDDYKIFKSIDYYKEIKFDDIEKNDPYYLLQEYYFLDDKDMEEELKILKDNIKNKNYNYKLFPKIINIISNIESLNFKVDLIHEIIDEITKILEKQTVEDLTFHQFFEDNNVAGIYNKNIKHITDRLNSIRSSNYLKNVEDALNSEEWGVNLYDFVSKNRQRYLNQKAFLKSFDIDRIIDNIEKSNVKNIYYFNYCLHEIYNFSNLNEYYSDDKDNIEKLMESLEKMNKENFGVNKKKIINYIINILKSIIEKL